MHIYQCLLFNASRGEEQDVAFVGGHDGLLNFSLLHELEVGVLSFDRDSRQSVPALDPYKLSILFWTRDLELNEASMSGLLVSSFIGVASIERRLCECPPAGAELGFAISFEEAGGLLSGVEKSLARKGCPSESFATVGLLPRLKLVRVAATQ